MGPNGVELAGRTLQGSGAPDLGAVDDVARLLLLARRLGVVVVLTDVAPALRELLELAGLPVEMEGQPELADQALGLEQGHEEGPAGDPPL